MRRNLTVPAIALAIVGVAVILIGLATQVCTPQSDFANGPVFGGCGWRMLYAELYSGIALIIVGIILALWTARIKSNPSTEGIQNEQNLALSKNQRARASP
ncbi:MAG: hypothetical protein JRN67_01650 [Nitrososphaerota archaeon]|nr:hypothetical protein [Nitrososphaerota archaeon]